MVVVIKQVTAIGRRTRVDAGEDEDGIQRYSNQGGPLLVETVPVMGIDLFGEPQEPI